MDKLSDLINIGKELNRQLNEAGIYTYEDLKNNGSKQAWLKILAMDPSACINRLYALEGAIQGIKKNEISTEVKEDLKNFYNDIKHKGK